MEKIKCQICSKQVSNNNSYIGSHVKRCHDILLYNYCIEYYLNIGEDIEDSYCKSCNAIIKPQLEIDHIKCTYSKNKINYFLCDSKNQSELCKNNISEIVLGTGYNKKSYEHIGSNHIFLSLAYNIDSDSAKMLKCMTINSIKKNNPLCNDIEAADMLSDKINLHNKKAHRSNLNDYIIRYGDVLGTKKYNERCYKISESNSERWYINKYGEEKGKELWASRIKKYEKNRGSSISKSQNIFFDEVVSLLNTEVIQEYAIKNINNRYLYVDYYLPDKKIIIEFFGDYWHCNPRKYNSNYYHKVLKMNAIDVWKKDKERLDYIYEYFGRDVYIITVWEGSNIDLQRMNEIITNLPTMKTKIEL